MLKILITYAVQGEFVEIKWPDIEPYYVRTGIGKVKSAFHLAEAIRQVQPDLVLNIGSAGTVNHQVGDIFVCRKFVDRDMEAYAQAFVCRSKEIPFISVKYVTDIIGQNSVKHWEDKLADARQGLSHYFNVLKERI